MKKLFISVTMLASVAMFSGSAFALDCGGGYGDLATGVAAITAATTLPALTITGSKNVCGDYVPIKVEFDGDSYSICTFHYSGDKTYGSSEEKQIILQSSAKGTVCPTDLIFANAWTSL